MSRPRYPGPSHPAQSSAHHPDPIEPDHYCDDQLPPDPLLKFGDVIRKADTDSPMETKKGARSSSGAESTPPLFDPPGATYVTPVSQWRPAALPEDAAERPNWLPEGWKFERRVRVSGATAGTIDRYFISPSEGTFRSKAEVLHFLQTGSRRKKRSDPDAGSVPTKEKSDRGGKKSKDCVKDFSNLNFDFKNPPESATWVPTDISKDEWTAIVGNTTVPESDKSNWNNAFARLTELEKGDI